MNQGTPAGFICKKTTSISPIRLKTLLNKFHPLNCFDYSLVIAITRGGKPLIHRYDLPRSNFHPICSGYGKRHPGQDRMPPSREFRSIPVVHSYAILHLDCPACGVKSMAVPWAQGKHLCCDTYRHFLASFKGGEFNELYYQGHGIGWFPRHQTVHHVYEHLSTMYPEHTESSLLYS